MAKDPAFLFYYKDFLVSTALMTPGEVGSYARILCHMADKGPLSMFQLKQIAENGTLTEDLIGRLPVNGKGLHYSPRLEEVMTKRKKFRESRLDNLNSHKDEGAMEPHMVNVNENSNTSNNYKVKFLEFVFMTQGQYDQLANKLGKESVDKYIEKVNNYVGSKGKRYKSHYHTILTWASKDDGIKSLTNPTKKEVVKKYKIDCFMCKGTGKMVGGSDCSCWK